MSDVTDLAAEPITKPFSDTELVSLRHWAEVGVKLFDAPEARLILRLIEEIHFARAREHMEEDEVYRHMALLIEAAGGEIVMSPALRRTLLSPDRPLVIQFEDPVNGNTIFQSARAMNGDTNNMIRTPKKET